MDLRQRIWNLMGPERRQAAAEAFWGSESPSTETLENAVRQLLEKYRKVDVLVYLGALVIQDGVFWANLRPIVERMESHLQTDDGPSTVTT